MRVTHSSLYINFHATTSRVQRKRLVIKFHFLNYANAKEFKPTIDRRYMLCCVYIKSGISCRSRSRVHVPRTQLAVSLITGIHQICIPAFPSDPPTQSDTYHDVCNYVYMS